MRKVVARGAAMLAAAGLVGTMALPAYAAIVSAPETRANTPISSAVGLRPQGLPATAAHHVALSYDGYTVTEAKDRVDPQAVAARAIQTATRQAASAAARQTAAAHAARSAQLLGTVAPDPIYSGAAILAYGSQFIGVVPYGTGNSPDTSFSCDGFVQYVFAKFGMVLPRTADRQAALGVRLDQADAVAGDLVWWPGAHIGIYDGAGGMINSPSWGRFAEHPTTLWGNPVFIRLR